mmetsp:Transcript_7318/g.14538  ORF Transcript_7318/g.14538 Transcript_7318/m.14538 type:complete len:368 (-) Transcript_7318:243-1346(-)
MPSGARELALPLSHLSPLAPPFPLLRCIQRLLLGASLGGGVVVARDLLEDELADVGVGEVFLLFVLEVELLVALWLVVRIVQLRHVVMRQRHLWRKSFAGVECKEVVEEIEHACARVGEVRLPLGARLFCEASKKVLGLVAHMPLVLERRIADFGCLQLEHVHVILAREERLAAKQLRENAAHRPHVDRLVVILLAQEELRRSVPASDHVHCHERLVQLGRQTRQTQVTNLEVAIGVHKEVIRLEITMHDIGRVEVLQSTQDLIREISDVVVGKGLGGANDAVEVGVHQVCDDVDILELGLALRALHDVLNADNILVATEVTKQLQLAQQQFPLFLVFNSILDFLYCTLQTATFLLCCNDHAISTFS